MKKRKRPKPTTLDDIFGIWSSREAMAQSVDMLPQTIYRWHKAQRIPYTNWCRVIAAAKKEGCEITSDDLMKLCVPMRKLGWPRGKLRNHDELVEGV